MTAVVASALATPYIPPQPPLDATQAGVTTPIGQQSESTAPALSNNPIVSDATIGALVAQQGDPSELSKPSSAPLDLQGKDLREADLKKLDLRGADLTGANLSGLDLSGLDLSGAKLTGANLSGANLTNTNLTGVSAQGADLSSAKLDNTSLSGADFSDSKFDGAYIGRSDGNADPYHQVFLKTKDAKFDGASFAGASLQWWSLSDGSAEGANFSAVKVDHVQLDRMNLRNANFDEVSGYALFMRLSDFSDGKFTNSRMASTTFGAVVGFGATKLDGAKFAGSSLNQTSFHAGNLTTADMTGVIREAKGSFFDDSNISGMDFSGFDFTRAYFGGAKQPYHDIVPGGGSSFQGTNFKGARFEAALFDTTDLTGADFSNATFSNVSVQGGLASLLLGLSGIEFSRSASIQGSVAASRSPLSLDDASSRTMAPAAAETTAALALETLQTLREQIQANYDKDRANDGILSLFQAHDEQTGPQGAASVT